MPTTVVINKLASLLNGFGKKDYIVDGFTNGFHIHFDRPEVPTQTRNSRVAEQNATLVDNKLKEELEAVRTQGLFHNPPFKNFKCSPLSLHEKSTAGTYRLRHNLSGPYDNHSVNKNIAHEHKAYQYVRLRNVIRLIQEVGQGAYLSKADKKSAFRIVPLYPDFYHLMGFSWREQYYFDTCLAMGLAEACHIFPTISDAIVFILN